MKLRKQNILPSTLLQPCKTTNIQTRRLPLVEQELSTLPEHPSWPRVLSGVRGVTRFLVLCVGFVDHCLSFCSFSFGHFVVCPTFTDDSHYPFGIFKLFFNNNYTFTL